MHTTHTCRGDASLLDRIPAATVITGSRAATAYGMTVAGDHAALLTHLEHPVVTGLGFGIEAAAVRGVLSAGGRPIVVMGTGIDRPYPAAHADLLAAVLDAGGVVLGLADGAPTRERLLARSQWLGTQAARTLIVEAAARSSALPVAEAAKAASKLVGAVPGPVTSATSVGTHRLLEAGAFLVHDEVSLLAFAADRTRATDNPAACVS